MCSRFKEGLMAVNTEEEEKSDNYLFKLSEAKWVSLNMNIECAEVHIDFGLLRIDGIIHSLFSFVCSHSALFASCLCFTHFITLLSSLFYLCSNKQTGFGCMTTQNQILGDLLDLKRSWLVNDWKRVELLKFANLSNHFLFRSDKITSQSQLLLNWSAGSFNSVIRSLFT